MIRHTRVSIVSGSFTAILARQPGRRRRDHLLVVVDVEVEAGSTVALVAAEPQGINPLIKLLRIRLEPQAPPGAIVRRTLRYEEAPAGADYQEVWLGEGDAAISAKVAIVI